MKGGWEGEMGRDEGWLGGGSRWGGMKGDWEGEMGRDEVRLGGRDEGRLGGRDGEG